MPFIGLSFVFSTIIKIANTHCVCICFALFLFAIQMIFFSPHIFLPLIASYAWKIKHCFLCLCIFSEHMFLIILIKERNHIRNDANCVPKCNWLLLVIDFVIWVNYRPLFIIIRSGSLHHSSARYKTSTRFFWLLDDWNPSFIFLPILLMFSLRSEKTTLHKLQIILSHQPMAASTREIDNYTKQIFYGN